MWNRFILKASLALLTNVHIHKVVSSSNLTKECYGTEKRKRYFNVRFLGDKENSPQNWFTFFHFFNFF